MPIINRVGGGAGGGGLNFKVQQFTTTPTGTAEDNTIAVITDTTITEGGWGLSALAPPENNGMVWIEIASASDVAFSVNEKRMVMVYPKAVKQYVDGAWKNVEAYIYQDNSWVQFSQTTLYLFQQGVSNDMVGGWTNRYGSDAITEDYIEVCDGTTKNTWYIAKSNNAIDLTPFSTISFRVKADGSSWTKTATVGVSLSNSDQNFDASAAVISSESYSNIDQIFTVDISNLTGEYYIKAYARNGNASYGDSAYMRIYDVYLS